MLRLSCEKKYILKLLNAFVNDTKVSPEEDVDWAELKKITDRQNISGLVASVISKFNPECRPCNYNDWHFSMLNTVRLMGKKFADFEFIRNKLSVAGVDFICLKGIVIKDYYPICELRTMGDFDIFIRNEQVETVKNTFTANGYELFRQPLCLTFRNKFGTNFEVFTTLNEEFDKNTVFYDEMVRKKSVKWYDNVYRMDDTTLFAHCIIHSAKHFLTKGCGVRYLVDAAIIYQKMHNSIDIAKVRDMCAAQGYDKFCCYLFSALNKYFGFKFDVNTDDEIIDIFVSDMLEFGVFGKKIKNDVFVPHLVGKSRSKSKGIRRVFFPSVSMLSHKYSYLQRCRWLLPFAWIHRFCYAVFKKHYSVGKLFTNYRCALNYYDDRKNVLKKLDL